MLPRRRRHALAPDLPRGGLTGINRAPYEIVGHRCLSRVPQKGRGFFWPPQLTLRNSSAVARGPTAPLSAAASIRAVSDAAKGLRRRENVARAGRIAILEFHKARLDRRGAARLVITLLTLTFSKPSPSADLAQTI